MLIWAFIINHLINIETIFLTSLFTYLILLVINSFLHPYPKNTVDHFIRKHLRKAGIRGQKLTIYRELFIQDNINHDILDSIIIKNSEWNINIDLKLIDEIGAEVSQPSKVNHTASFNLKVGNINGILKLEELPSTYGFENMDGGQNVEQRITIEISIKKWKLGDIKDFLHDSIKFFDTFSKNLSSKLTTQIGNSETTLSFELGKKPAAIDYLSKVNINYISSKVSGMTFSLSDKLCTFKGINTSPQFEDVIDAMVWYV